MCVRECYQHFLYQLHIYIYIYIYIYICDVCKGVLPKFPYHEYKIYHKYKIFKYNIYKYKI